MNADMRLAQAMDSLEATAMGIKHERDALRVHVKALAAVLDEIEEFLDDQQDTVDGSDGEPRPNKAMSLLGALIQARAALKVSE